MIDIFCGCAVFEGKYEKLILNEMYGNHRKFHSNPLFSCLDEISFIGPNSLVKTYTTSQSIEGDYLVLSTTRKLEEFKFHVAVEFNDGIVAEFPLNSVGWRHSKLNKISKFWFDHADFLFEFHPIKMDWITMTHCETFYEGNRVSIQNFLNNDFVFKSIQL